MLSWIKVVGKLLLKAAQPEPAFKKEQIEEQQSKANKQTKQIGKKSRKQIMKI